MLCCSRHIPKSFYPTRIRDPVWRRSLRPGRDQGARREALAEVTDYLLTTKSRRSTAHSPSLVTASPVAATSGVLFVRLKPWLTGPARAIACRQSPLARTSASRKIADAQRLRSHPLRFWNSHASGFDLNCWTAPTRVTTSCCKRVDNCYLAPRMPPVQVPSQRALLRAAIQFNVDWKGPASGAAITTSITRCRRPGGRNSSTTLSTGSLKRVFIQGDARSRMLPAGSDRLVRVVNSAGQMVPVFRIRPMQWGDWDRPS